jgi:hypothetical protein
MGYGVRTATAICASILGLLSLPTFAQTSFVLVANQANGCSIASALYVAHHNTPTSAFKDEPCQVGDSEHSAICRVPVTSDAGSAIQVRVDCTTNIVTSEDPNGISETLYFPVSQVSYASALEFWKATVDRDFSTLSRLANKYFTLRAVPDSHPLSPEPFPPTPCGASESQPSCNDYSPTSSNRIVYYLLAR